MNKLRFPTSLLGAVVLGTALFTTEALAQKTPKLSEGNTAWLLNVRF